MSLAKQFGEYFPNFERFFFSCDQQSQHAVILLEFCNRHPLNVHKQTVKYSSHAAGINSLSIHSHA